MNLQPDTEIQILCKLNKHHLSDLMFLNDEMIFLKSLLEKYFQPMIRDTSVNRIQLINNHLAQVNLMKGNVTKDMLIHQGNLNYTFNNVPGKSINFLNLEHDRMEAELKDLHKCFKNIKKEIFAIYKDLHAEEPEKAKSLA